MKKSIAKLLTEWIPSSRYRRAVRRALCEVPSPKMFRKAPYSTASGKRYSTLVVPRGFGHSGSGVIGDLLSEYSGTTVFGGADPDGSGRFAGAGKANMTSFEVDLLKMPGGVIDLASAFGESRAWGKFKLLDFIHVVEYLYRMPNIPIYDDAFLLRSRAFVDELVEARWRSATPLAESQPFEMHAAPPDMRPDMLNPLYGWRENLAESYVMKNLTRTEYERIARRYMNDVLSSIPSNRILVMDQLLSVDLAPEELEKYVGPFRLVAVYRDPRDVFATGASHNMPWIPNDPHAFVKWYASLGIERLRSCGHSSVLVLRFEDIVREYERSVAAIEDFVGLSTRDHVRPKSGFDPARSSANIGIWRNWPDSAAMDYIRGELAGYCCD